MYSEVTPKYIFEKILVSGVSVPVVFEKDTKAVSTFYTCGAFLLDHERSSMLPQIASGVGSILFAINIDNAALDTGLTDAENEVKTINLLKVTGLSQITVIL